MRKLLLLVLVSCLALQLPVSAQVPPAGTPDLATGIRQVEEGDLEAAVVTLDVVIERLKSQKGREQDLATAHIYLAMAHLGLSQWERAKGEMREAWRNNQKLALDPKKFPPRVIQLYEETKPAPVVAPKAAPTPTPAPTLATTVAKKGGSKTTPILIGVGVAAAAGIGIGVAGGKGAAPAPTPTPVPTPTPAPTPEPTCSIVLVAADPPPGSTIHDPGAGPSGSNDLTLTMTFSVRCTMELPDSAFHTSIMCGGDICGGGYNLGLTLPAGTTNTVRVTNLRISRPVPFSSDGVWTRLYDARDVRIAEARFAALYNFVP